MFEMNENIMFGLIPVPSSIVRSGLKNLNHEENVIVIFRSKTFKFQELSKLPPIVDDNETMRFVDEKKPCTLETIEYEDYVETLLEQEKESLDFWERDRLFRLREEQKIKEEKN